MTESLEQQNMPKYAYELYSTRVMSQYGTILAVVFPHLIYQEVFYYPVFDKREVNNIYDILLEAGISLLENKL